MTMSIEGRGRAVGPREPHAPVTEGVAPVHVVCRLAGDLDLDRVGSARAALDEALSPHTDWLIVDLAAVTFCDSSGLNLLLQTRLTAERAGTGMRLAAVPEPMKRLLEITGASAVFPQYATVDAALQG
ncbi:hypothetical protein GCM10009665_37690 [Kitasatospora nipponensis]|uniref:Anti-sigma factor antagonist n=1 Tax=Kitasatospora nipponensis TaxID=258049 RepID=A0ABN1WBN7_9ACTN